MEMFHAFGFSERVMKEACWINETTFWKPDDEATREHRAQRLGQGVEDGRCEIPRITFFRDQAHGVQM